MTIQKSKKCHRSGEVSIFHQPRFPWNKGIALTKPVVAQNPIPILSLHLFRWKDPASTFDKSKFSGVDSFVSRRLGIVGQLGSWEIRGIPEIHGKIQLKTGESPMCFMQIYCFSWKSDSFSWTSTMFPMKSFMFFEWCHVSNLKE